MRSVNKVILIGNLTRDPEMRQTPNGQYVTTFGLATNREWVTRDNKKHSLPEYHDLVAWAKLAEICHQYLKKGKLIYVEGYLKTRSWDTPEGIRKFKTEIVVQDMIMLDKRANNDVDYIPEEENDMPVMENHSEKNQDQIKKQEPAAPPAAVLTPQSISIDGDLGL
jgi:single-strand DNA-binding protein